MVAPIRIGGCAGLFFCVASLLYERWSCRVWQVTALVGALLLIHICIYLHISLQLVEYDKQRKQNAAHSASQLTRIGAPRPDRTATPGGESAKEKLITRVLNAGADMRRLIDRLSSIVKHRQATQNGSSETTLVHGDFRMGNFILDPEAGEVKAVLDWEISTLGHPLADLAYLASPWYTVGDNGYLKSKKQLRPGEKVETVATQLPEGIPQLKEYLQMYCDARGIPPIPEAEWNFWVALNSFRNAGIVHGVFARFVVTFDCDICERTTQTLQPIARKSLQRISTSSSFANTIVKAVVCHCRTDSADVLALTLDMSYADALQIRGWKRRLDERRICWQ